MGFVYLPLFEYQNCQISHRICDIEIDQSRPHPA